MNKKLSLISSALVFLIAACNTNQTVNITNTKDQIGDNKLNLYNSGSNDKNSKVNNPNIKIQGINAKNEPLNKEQEIPAASFDEVPSYGKENIDPGTINVIYKNEKKIRIDKSNNKVKSLDSEASDKLNKILTKYHIKTSNDGAGDEKDEALLDQKEKVLSFKSKSEIPHLKSVHSYQFPDSEDTIKIADELRKLPFVRTAYPAIQVKPSGFQMLVSQTKNNIRYSGTIPNDTDFSGNENTYWLRFNRHKAFQAWDFYTSMVGGSDINSVPKPLIAVIDTGFDTGFVATDRPNYVQGFSVDQNNNIVIGDTNGLATDTSYTRYGETISHGARMASLIGSPSNNNSKSAGMLPNAPILPIKIKGNSNNYYTDTTIGYAIQRAANSSAKLMNVSISLLNNSNQQIPISLSPFVATQIYYSTYSSNKPVIIAAGNSDANLDDSSIRTCNSNICPTNPPPCSPYPSCQDKGQIVVGGSSTLGLSWKSVSPNIGTSYGKMVTLTAYAGAASSNFANSYDVTNSNPSSTYISRGAHGTSDSTCMVTATIAMMMQIGSTISYNYTASQLRDLVAYTGTPLRGSTVSNSPETRFLGKYLGETSSISENSDSIAGMRELNMYNAINFVYYASMFNTITRVFNIDDSTEATINSNWSSPYTMEPTTNDSFWGSNDYNPPNSLTFRTNNTSGNGSAGYQVYRYGLLNKEKIHGVSKVYNTWSPTYLTDSPVYNTIGTNSLGYFSQGLFSYP